MATFQFTETARETRLKKRNERKEQIVIATFQLTETARETRLKKRNERKEKDIDDIVKILGAKIRYIQTLPIKKRVINSHKLFCEMNKYLPKLIESEGHKIFIPSSYTKTVSFISKVTKFIPNEPHSAYTIRVFMNQLKKYKYQIENYYEKALDDVILEKLEITIPLCLLKEIVSYLLPTEITN